MAQGLGLAEETRRPPGLGLATPTVSRETASGSPREVDTTQAALRARAEAPAAPAATAAPAGSTPAAKPKSRIPSLKDDPLRAIAFALSEGALAFAGRPTNLPTLMQLDSEDEAREQAKALTEQSLHLRQAAATMDAIRTGAEILKQVPAGQKDKAITDFERTIGLPGIADTLRAIDRPGVDAEAVVGFLDENPDMVPGLSSLMRKGIVTPEGAVDMIGDLVKKQAESQVETAAKAEQAQTDAALDLEKQDILKQIDTREANKREAFKKSLTAGEVDIKDEAGLRKEYTSLSKDFIAVRDAFQKVQRGIETASAAGDVAMVFNFMKMLDPTSVVREGEFAVAAEAAGLPDRMVQFIRRVGTGERLTPEQRKDFANVAKQVFETQSGAQKKLVSEFTRVAESSGLRPENVIVDFNAASGLSDDELRTRLGLDR